MRETGPFHALLVGLPETDDGVGAVFSDASSFVSVHADGVADAIDRLDEVDCIVSAEDLPDGSGVSLLETVRQERPSVPVVLCVDEQFPAVTAEALAAGATNVVPRRPRQGQLAALPDRLLSTVEGARAPPALSTSEHTYRHLFEIAPVPIWIQREAEILFCNDAAADFFGAAGPEAVIGRSALEVVAPDERERARERNRRMLEEDRTSKALDGRIVGFDGIVRHGLFAGTPITYDADAALLVVARNVTELRQRENELERQNERLEEFANAVSHDLRNPLQVAAGYLEAARQSCDDDALAEVASAHERMHDIIGDVLTLARKGRTVDETSPVSLSRVATTAWTSIDHDASLNCEGDLTFEADVSRLQSLLENLFANAVEHGDATAVRVGPLTPDGDLDAASMEAGRAAASDGTGFYVEDDGPGIPPDRRESVFESGVTTATGGTGFGLAIVRRIAEAHGWSVTCTDGTDGGARFEVLGVAEVDR